MGWNEGERLEGIKPKENSRKPPNFLVGVNSKKIEKSTFKCNERNKTLALLQKIEKKRHSYKNDHLLNWKIGGITG